MSLSPVVVSKSGPPVQGQKRNWDVMSSSNPVHRVSMGVGEMSTRGTMIPSTSLKRFLSLDHSSTRL